MKIKQLLNISIIFLPLLATAQTLEGQFSQLPNQSIKLLGFDNFDTYIIDSTQTDANGYFKLTYEAEDYGMGYLKTNSDKPFVLAIEENAPIIKGQNLQATETLTIEQGKENKRFLEYAQAHPKRQQVLSAWRFLKEKYTNEEVLESRDEVRRAITDEIQQLKNADEQYIKDLPAESYMKWYLPLRSLLSSVGNVAQNRPALIPETRQKLRAIDYTEDKLYKSGLLYDAVFNHIWFIENSSGALDQVFKDLNTSIDIIADQLKNDEDKFNLVLGKMFEILEERSLFTSSEYLAEKLLNSDDCGCLNPQLQKKLERYGRMAQGKTAPNIEFSEYTYYPEGVDADNLKALDAKYKVVVFAAGWCPHCTKEIPKIEEHYEDWKSNNAEVVMISLDENAKDFANFAAPLPFISTTDYQKWNGQAVEDYQVYATPSYFILDKDLEILIRPKSVEHINAWLKSKS